MWINISNTKLSHFFLHYLEMSCHRGPLPITVELSNYRIIVKGGSGILELKSQWRDLRGQFPSRWQPRGGHLCHSCFQGSHTRAASVGCLMCARKSQCCSLRCSKNCELCTSGSVANSLPDFSASEAEIRTQGNEFRLMENLVILRSLNPRFPSTISQFCCETSVIRNWNA
jgi:hypothetical protein